MLEIIRFIDYINGYLDDDYSEYINFLGANYYFTNAGCYEFAKIITHFIPSAKMYRSIPKLNYDHIIIKIGDNFYDTTGILNKDEINKTYYEIDEFEQNSLNDTMGRPEIKIEDQNIADFLIKEITLVISEMKGKSIDLLVNSINERINNEEPKLNLQKVLKKEGTN